MKSIPALFAEVVAQHAQRVAISTPEANWNYAELDQRSDAIAAQMLGPLDRTTEVVALLLPHGTSLISAILGVLKAGRLYLALDPTEPLPRLAARLEDSDAKLLVADSSNLPLARQLESSQVVALELSDEPALPSARVSFPEVSPSAGAWLVYTSGSTAEPKGVWQNHCGAIHHASVYRELIAVTPEDRLTLLTSLSLAASATHLFAALLSGATLCPFPLRAAGSGRLAKWLGDQHITVFHSVPTVYRHLLRSTPECMSSPHLRLIRLGGEPILAADVDQFRRHTRTRLADSCVLMHALSSTETGMICAQMIDRNTALPPGRVSVGCPVRDVEVFLADEHGQPVGENREGRIAVRSEFLAQGYWRRAEATAASFRLDPRNHDRRVFVTGDLGRIRSDRSLEHLGRVDQQVKIGGWRVDLAEVETALHSVESVDSAAVIPRDTPVGGQRLVAYVTARDRNAKAAGDVTGQLRKLLPEHMIPSQFVWLEELPQTTGGKLDRRALAQRPLVASSPRDSKRGPKPRDGIERKVARVWESVLGVGNLPRDQDLFELDANSLQATEALLGLEATFGVVLSPADLVEHRTVESLAALIAGYTVGRSSRSLVTLRAADSGRPLFLIHSGHGDVATYAQLARRLPGRPIYGLQAVGLQGESWPQMSVRAMARRYLEEILAANPEGPYLLAGTCMGGLVAFELACRLVEQGREVRFVGLMDTTAPPFGGRRSPWVEMIVDPFRDTLRIARWAALRSVGYGRGGDSLPAYRHFIGSITSRARYYYRPRCYPGTITMFSTTETAYPRGDRRQLMAQYATDMRTIPIPARREELFLPPAVDELARQLQACLEVAEGGIRSGRPPTPRLAGS